MSFRQFDWRHYGLMDVLELDALVARDVRAVRQLPVGVAGRALKLEALVTRIRDERIREVAVA